MFHINKDVKISQLLFRIFLVLSSSKNKGTKAKKPRKNKSRGGQANQNNKAGEITYKSILNLFFVIPSNH